MALIQFNNLFNFFNLIEFCPLCKKRTEYITTLYNRQNSLLTNTLHISRGNQIKNDKFSINLIDNTVIGDYVDYDDTTQLIIGRQCNKYHFFYSGTCDIIKNKLSVQNILLEKSHFIRIMPDSVHFAINNNFLAATSTIHMTANYYTKTIVLPLVDFDFSSKKKIDKKLKMIQLLG